MGNAFDWSMEQNRQLIEQQRVSFETVVSAMEQGALLDVLVHPNQAAIPDNTSKWWSSKPTFTLKTIIPSRKATREYRRRQP